MSEGTSDESEPKGSVGSEVEMNPVGRGSSISLEMGWISRVSQAGWARCSIPGWGPGSRAQPGKANPEDPRGAVQPRAYFQALETPLGQGPSPLVRKPSEVPSCEN